MNEDLKLGEVVVFRWGVADVLGTVAEIYGRAPRVHVVIELSPELSGYVVDQPTTVSLPIEDVRRAVAA